MSTKYCRGQGTCGVANNDYAINLCTKLMQIANLQAYIYPNCQSIFLFWIILIHICTKQSYFEQVLDQYNSNSTVLESRR